MELSSLLWGDRWETYKAGSRYFNYKLWRSIVLLAVVSADYIFLLVDVEDCSRHSDGGVLQSFQFGQALLTDQLDLPWLRLLIGADPNLKISFMFVADEAFPLRCNIMRPYPGKGLPQGLHKLFAYGCPGWGREFDKRTDKELLKRLFNIYN